MSTSYQSSFDPKAYFECYFNDPKKIDTFPLEKQNHFWSDVVKDINVASTLEYGAGPTISRFISASHYAQNIIAAEYLESNRKALQDWITQDPKAFNWRPYFEYVVQTLEGKSSEEVDKRESEVREKIKAIVPCDLKSPSNRLEIPSHISAKYGPPFDVVSSCLCLEAVVGCEKEYKEAMAYLAKLVRPDGYLVMIGTIGCTFYTVDGKRFDNFPNTKELVLESMSNAGLNEVVFECAEEKSVDFERRGGPDLYDGDGFFFAYGRRE